MEPYAGQGSIGAPKFAKDFLAGRLAYLGLGMPVLGEVVEPWWKPRLDNLGP